VVDENSAIARHDYIEITVKMVSKRVYRPTATFLAGIEIVGCPKAGGMTWVEGTFFSSTISETRKIVP